MKSIFGFLPLMILVLFYSCESYSEDEVICLPVSMNATIVKGTETKKIIADFHYIPETDRLDRPRCHCSAQILRHRCEPHLNHYPHGS